MVLKRGYKQTEVGLIPEDWDIKRLREIAFISSGGTPSRERADYWGGSIPWVTTTLIDFNLIQSASEYITQQGLENSATRLYKSGTLLMAMYGQGKTRGKVAKLGIHASINQACAAIQLDNSVLDSFVFYYLSFKYEEIRKLSNTGNQENLNILIISGIPLLLPPLAEQHAIATALSDVDALLASLDALIAKKRLIQQGAMQELLTGKRRLPGFSGEWVTKTLEEVTYCLDNLRVPLNEKQRREMQGDIPYCGANGVLDYVNNYIIDDSIILMAEDGGYFDEYTTRPIAYRMKGKCWVNNHAHILKAKENVDQNFVFYSLVNKNILRFLASGTRAKLNKYEMYKIEINIPKEPIEQKDISTILCDLDDEIELLENRRKKTHLIKQGMMQELLTGRTRLV